MENYKIEKGVLTVIKDLRQDFDLSFDQACGQLLSSKDKELCIDLTSVSYINSTYIGIIAATFFQAQAGGKTLSVKAPAPVLQVFKVAGFEGFISLQEV